MDEKLDLDEQRRKNTEDLIKRGESTWTEQERIYVATSAILDGHLTAAAQLLQPLGFRWRGATLRKALRSFLDKYQAKAA